MTTPPITVIVKQEPKFDAGTCCCFLGCLLPALAFLGLVLFTAFTR